MNIGTNQGISVMQVVFSWKNNKPVKALPKALAVALVAAGVLSSVSQASATQIFKKKILLPSTGEVFNLSIETEDGTSTVTIPAFTAPTSCQPSGSPDCAGVTTVTPQLQSPGYKFTGYKITKITGTAYEKGISYDILGTGLASATGVFNYPDSKSGNLGPVVQPDSIPHSLPDQLFNPGGLGLGFDSAGFTFGAPVSAFASFPSGSLDNYFSFGGITFDIGKYNIPGDESSFVFDEPYQLFTVAYDSTSTSTGESLNAGSYAGCPGSCRGAVVQTPGPLPLLGLGAAFGYSRRLRKRVKGGKPPEAVSFSI
jgi:hypothetical protein